MLAFAEAEAKAEEITSVGMPLGTLVGNPEVKLVGIPVGIPEIIPVPVKLISDGRPVGISDGLAIVKILLLFDKAAVIESSLDEKAAISADIDAISGDKEVEEELAVLPVIEEVDVGRIDSVPETAVEPELEAETEAEAERDEMALARLAETFATDIEAETLDKAAEIEAGSIGVVAVAIIEEMLAS